MIRHSGTIHLRALQVGSVGFSAGKIAPGINFLSSIDASLGLGSIPTIDLGFVAVTPAEAYKRMRPSVHESSLS